MLSYDAMLVDGSVYYLISTGCLILGSKVWLTSRTSHLWHQLQQTQDLRSFALTTVNTRDTARAKSLALRLGVSCLKNGRLMSAAVCSHEAPFVLQMQLPQSCAQPHDESKRTLFNRFRQKNWSCKFARHYFSLNLCTNFTLNQCRG